MSITDERKKAILFSDALLRRHPGVAGPDGRTVEDAGRPEGQEAGRPGRHHRPGLREQGGCRQRLHDRRVPGPRHADPGPVTSQVDAAINDLPVWSDAIKEDKGKAIVGPQFDTGERLRLRHEAGQRHPEEASTRPSRPPRPTARYDVLYKKWIGTERPKYLIPLRGWRRRPGCASLAMSRTPTKVGSHEHRHRRQAPAAWPAAARPADPRVPVRRRAVVLVSGAQDRLGDRSARLLRGDIFAAMWPRVITIGLINTLIYTALAFVFGLAWAWSSP